MHYVDLTTASDVRLKFTLVCTETKGAFPLFGWLIAVTVYSCIDVLLISRSGRAHRNAQRQKTLERSYKEAIRKRNNQSALQGGNKTRDLYEDIVEFLC